MRVLAASGAAGAGVAIFQRFVAGLRENEVRFWLRSATDHGLPLSPEALASSSSCGKLADVVEKHGWKNLLAVELPDGERWPRERMSGPLFIRDFYDRVWTDLLCDLQPLSGGYAGITEPSKFVLLGTPGIGKTAFTMYCLLRALVDKRPVRYRMCVKGARTPDYIFNVHVNEVGTVAGGSPPAPAKDYVFIHDSNMPDDGIASDASGSLLVTSPDVSVWRPWLTQGQANFIVFPTHTRDELLTLAWLTGCDPRLVDEGMANFGGVPRYVLNAAAAKVRLGQARRAISSLTEVQISNIAAGVLSDMPEVQHTIFYEDVDRDTFEATGTLHIPPNLLPHVMDHIIARQVLNASQLIRMLQLVPSASNFAGRLLEPHIIRLMSSAEFPLRLLTPAVHIMTAGGKETNLPAPAKLSFAKTIETVRVEGFAATLSDHLPPPSPKGVIRKCVLPDSQTQAAVDFVLSNGALCNVTLQLSHNIVVEGSKGAGLRALLAACPQLIHHHGEHAFVDFVWWQLASRASDQLPGRLTFGEGCKREGDEGNVIVVNGERVHVRQFVVAASLTPASWLVQDTYTTAAAAPTGFGGVTPARAKAGAGAATRKWRATTKRNLRA
ncbi:MAG: hypothetical protein EOO65_03550, partial [Methanosarcinales archaeon]